MSDQQQMTVQGLRDLAAKYMQNAQQCREVSDYLNRMTTNIYWQSDAATSFHGHMSEYMQALSRFEQQFTSLNRDLLDRANLIEQSQSAPAVGS